MSEVLFFISINDSPTYCIHTRHFKQYCGRLNALVPFLLLPFHAADCTVVVRKIYMCDIRSGVASRYVGALWINYCSAFPVVYSQQSQEIHIIYLLLLLNNHYIHY